MLDVLISKHAFAKALSLSMSAFKRLEKRGGLPPRYALPGRRVGYRERDVQAYIDALPVVEHPAAQRQKRG